MVSSSPDTVVPLGRHSLPALARRLSVPSYDVRELRPGVLHVGTGRFHRAHQARYFDDLAETGATQWGVVGAGTRSRSHHGLAAQDHLFTVVEAGPGTTTARVVGSLTSHLSAADQRDELLALLDSEELQLVTLTVTAEAYLDEAATGESVFTLLAAALDLRRLAGRPPFTVLSCDNVSGGLTNGDATRRAVTAAAARQGASGPALAAWLEDRGAFPASMADRITPPLDEDGMRLVVAEFGVADPYAVLAEPFREWVVEDHFSGERPPLDEVGVRFVTDVRPYLAAKTRVVNGAHCAVGYLGAAAGHLTTAAATADPALRVFLHDLLHEEVGPGLERPDTTAYLDATLARIANPALADPLERLCRRGSIRVPAYVVPALADALDAGRPARRLTTVLAGWLSHLRTAAPGEAGDVGEVGLVAPAGCAHHDPRPFLQAVDGLARFSGHRAFVADLRHALVALETRGVAAALDRCRPSGDLAVVPTDVPAPRRRPVTSPSGALTGPSRRGSRRRRDDGTLDAVC